jgi:hypothetical protein
LLSSGYACYPIVRKKKQKIVTDVLHFSCYTFFTFAAAFALDNSTDLVQALILVQGRKPSVLKELLRLSIQVIFTNLVFSSFEISMVWMFEYITVIPFEYSIYNIYKFRLLLQLPQINLPVFTLIGLQSGSKVTWHPVPKNTVSVPSDFCASLYITSSDWHWHRNFNV